jgi:hypothetical protein
MVCYKFSASVAILLLAARASLTLAARETANFDFGWKFKVRSILDPARSENAIVPMQSRAPIHEMLHSRVMPCSGVDVVVLCLLWLFSLVSLFVYTFDFFVLCV